LTENRSRGFREYNGGYSKRLGARGGGIKNYSSFSLMAGGPALDRKNVGGTMRNHGGVGRASGARGDVVCPGNHYPEESAGRIVTDYGNL